MRRYRAFRTGLHDGWDQPFDMSVGMTYANPGSQFFWDVGSIIGQFFGRIFNRRAQRA